MLLLVEEEQQEEESPLGFVLAVPAAAGVVGRWAL
jgi:hypothetical protein